MSKIAPASGASACKVLALGLIFSLQIVNDVQAQTPPSRFRDLENTNTNISSYYYLVEPGSATVQISAFGKMKNPGVYIVEEGANLAFLLALGGGPESSNQPDIKESTTVKLYRNNGSARTLAFESSFDEVMDRAADSPTLSEGDIVIVDVEVQRKMNWRDVFTVIGPILSTLLLVERLTSSN